MRHICGQTNRSWEGKRPKPKYGPKCILLMCAQYLLDLMCVCVCVLTGTTEAGGSPHTNGADGVQPGSRKEEDEAHPCWDHYRSSEQQRSSTGYTHTHSHTRAHTHTQAYYNVALYARRLHHLKPDWSHLPVFCSVTRRMPGVPERRASWADTSGERGAGLTATRQSPSQHIRGPDHGLDGERGYDCSMVWTQYLQKLA